MHVEGRHVKAEGCMELVSWAAPGFDAAKTYPEQLSIWLRCWTEEFTFGIFF